MAFDLESLLANPQFQMGLGVLGASQRSPGLTQAYEILQQRQQQEAARQKLMQQMQMEAARSKLYEEQVNQQRIANEIKEREARLAEEQATRTKQAYEEFAPMIRGAMGSIGGQPAPMQQPQMEQPQPSLPPVSSVFDKIDPWVAKIEGGLVPNDAGKGLTNYGVNQKANPDVDVRNLTPESASQVRRQRYWDAIQGDQVQQTFGEGAAMVAYDAAINQGQQYAQQLLEKTGGDPKLMLYQRKLDYQNLAKSNPLYKPYLKSWESRLDQLSQQISAPTTTTPIAPTTQQPTRPGMEPYRAFQVAGAGYKLATGDVGGALSGLAAATKPDYEGQRVVTEKAELERKEREFAQEPEQKQKIEFAKGLANEYLTSQVEARKASARKSQMQMLDTYLQGLNTGKFTPLTTEARLWMKAAGIDVDPKTPEAQVASMIGNTLAMSMRDPSQGAGSPGQITEWEQKQFQALMPNIDKDPRTNKLIAKAYIRQQERVEGVAKIYRDYKKAHGSKLDEGVYDEIAKYVESYPLFDKEEVNTIVERSKITTQPFQDSDKERRYQEWKKRQAK